MTLKLKTPSHRHSNITKHWKWKGTNIYSSNLWFIREDRKKRDHRLDYTWLLFFCLSAWGIENKCVLQATNFPSIFFDYCVTLVKQLKPWHLFDSKTKITLKRMFRLAESYPFSFWFKKFKLYLTMVAHNFRNVCCCLHAQLFFTKRKSNMYWPYFSNDYGMITNDSKCFDLAFDRFYQKQKETERSNLYLYTYHLN